MLQESLRQQAQHLGLERLEGRAQPRGVLRVQAVLATRDFAELQGQGLKGRGLGQGDHGEKDGLPGRSFNLTFSSITVPSSSHKLT